MSIDIPVWIVIIFCAAFIVQTWKIYDLYHDVEVWRRSGDEREKIWRDTAHKLKARLDKLSDET